MSPKPKPKHNHASAMFKDKYPSLKDRSIDDIRKDPMWSDLAKVVDEEYKVYLAKFQKELEVWQLNNPEEHAKHLAKKAEENAKKAEENAKKAEENAKKAQTKKRVSEPTEEPSKKRKLTPSVPSKNKGVFKKYTESASEDDVVLWKHSVEGLYIMMAERDAVMEELNCRKVKYDEDMKVAMDYQKRLNRLLSDLGGKLDDMAAHFINAEERRKDE